MTAPSKAEELWRKYQADGWIGPTAFAAAIHEYGAAVRARDAEILRDHYWDSYANDSTVKAHSDAIAAAIAREPLP